MTTPLRTRDQVFGPPPACTVSRHVRLSLGDDGAVILDLRNGQVLTANHVGSKVLALLLTKSTEPEIVAAISTEFSVDRATVAKDVGDFLRALAESGVIEGYRSREQDTCGF